MLATHHEKVMFNINFDAYYTLLAFAFGVSIVINISWSLSFFSFSKKWVAKTINHLLVYVVYMQLFQLYTRDEHNSQMYNTS